MLLDGIIIGIPALHGYGEVGKYMGNVMGYVIRLPELPVIYLNSDTIYTDDVKHVFETFKLEISILAAGTAILDEYKPILMTVEEIKMPRDKLLQTTWKLLTIAQLHDNNYQKP